MTRTRALVAGAIVLIALASATPASAHGRGPGDPKPSNWRSEVTAGRHPSTGVSVEVADGGIVTMTNTSNQTVTVMGYEGEPYLRLGPRGLFENRRSPATYLNTTATASTPIPSYADSGATPDWIHVSADQQVTWHDHRTHWMGGSAPPAVRASPGRQHVVIDRWEIPLVIAGHQRSVTGRLVWIPPPTPLPSLLIIVAAVVAAALVATTVTGQRAIGIVVLAIALADAIGNSLAVPHPPSAASIALLLPAGLLLIGVALPAANERRSAATVSGIVGTALVLAITHLSFLTHSQLPTHLPPAVARLALSVAFGLGIGVVIAAARTVRQHHQASEGRGRRLERMADSRSPAPPTSFQDPDIEPVIKH